MSSKQVGQLALALLLFYPILNLGLNSLVIDYGWWAHLANTVLWQQIKNTVLVVLSTVFFSTAIAVPTAWVMARKKFLGSNVLKFLLILPMVFPTYVGAVTYIDLFGSLLTETIPTWVSVGFIYSLFTYPYIYIPLYTNISKTSKHYHEMAVQSRATFWFKATKLLGPLYGAGLLASIMLVLLESVSDFGTASLFGIQTVTVGIYQLWFSANLPMMATQYALLLMAVCLLLGYSYSPMHVRNPVNSDSNNESKVSVWYWVPALPILALSVFIPTATMMHWLYKIGLNFDLELFVSALGNTLLLGVGTATACIVITYLMVKLQLWSRICSIGYFIPSAVLALAFLYLDFGIIQTTILVLMIPCVMRFISLSGNAIQSIHYKNNAYVQELKHIYPLSLKLKFYNEWRTYRGILLYSWIVIFIDTIKELNMTIFLQPFNYSSLSLQIYGFAHSEQPEVAGVYCLALILLLLPLCIVLLRKNNAFL